GTPHDRAAGRGWRERNEAHDYRARDARSAVVDVGCRRRRREADEVDAHADHVGRGVEYGDATPRRQTQVGGRLLRAGHADREIDERGGCRRRCRSRDDDNRSGAAQQACPPDAHRLPPQGPPRRGMWTAEVGGGRRFATPSPERAAPQLSWATVPLLATR